MNAMPGLYRSKSFRRLDENNFFTEHLEKDKKKILATACVQLFISTPQLDKWFKSSTGTLCFVKDVDQKNTYFFRLYSLMQGQLWEQKVQVPFCYSRLSVVFHYLTIVRFNFGFKFICEDEADRFFKVVGKYSQYFNASADYVNAICNNNNNTNQISSNTKQPLTQINELLLMNRNDGVDNVASLPVPESKSRRKSNSATRTESTISSLTSLNSSTMKPAASKTTQTPKTPALKTPQSTRSRTPSIIASIRQRAFSAERKKKIEKTDISCPFRCSTNDLHLNATDTDYRTQSASFSQRHSIGVNSPTLKARSPLQITPNLLQYRTISHPVISVLTKTNDDEAPRPTSASTTHHDREELELARELLYQHNLPIHRNSVKLFRAYIRSYGDVKRLKDLLRTNVYEKEKLNNFVDATKSRLEVSEPPQSCGQPTTSKSHISPSLTNAPTPPPSPKFITPRKLVFTPKYKSSATITSVHHGSATSTTATTTTTAITQTENLSSRKPNAEHLTKSGHNYMSSVSKHQERFTANYSQQHSMHTPSPLAINKNEYLLTPMSDGLATGANNSATTQVPLKKTSLKLMI